MITETKMTENRRLRLPRELDEEIERLAKGEARTWVGMARKLLIEAVDARLTPGKEGNGNGLHS